MRLHSRLQSEDDSLAQEFALLFRMKPSMAYIYDKRTQDERLYLHLSHKKRYRKARVSRKRKQGLIPNRIDISERHKEVENRKTFGHSEGDLILFKET